MKGLNNTPHTSMLKRICASVGLLLLAWLITTSQISEVTDMNGKYAVTYKTYCVLDAPVYKANGDLVIRDGNRDVQLRIKSYTVETVSKCP